MIKGATYDIEVTISDLDTGLPIDLTDVTGILVGLYGDGKRLFGKWSLNLKDGYDDVTITDAVNGVIEVSLSSNESINALEKMAKMEVLITFLNPNYNDETQINIATDIELEVVKRSIFEGITALWIILQRH